jgi:hypothetical protein
MLRLAAIALALWAATAYGQPTALLTGNDLRQLCTQSYWHAAGCVTHNTSPSW